MHSFAVHHRSHNDSTPDRLPCVLSPPALPPQTPTKHPALRLRGGRRTRYAPCAPSRIKEFTTKLESDLKGQLGGKFSGVSLEAEMADKLTEEQKQEVIHKGQKVVNDVQIRDLAEVVKLLAEDAFIDPQERFYITIDRLDENWADEKIRYKLIRALIETIRTFGQIKTVKIVIALRTDLLERVCFLTRDAGFQEEKYESLYLPIRWSKDNLRAVLDRRVEALIREQYTTRPVRLPDILTWKLGEKSGTDYILERTFMRPRDAILFLNKCLEKAEGKAMLALKDVRAAEGEYSAKRLSSLQDEWGVQFPNVVSYTRILEKKQIHFKMRTISRDEMDNFVLGLCADSNCLNDPIYLEAQKYIDGKRTLNSFNNFMFRILYKLGVVGVKTDSHTPTRWSYLDVAILPEGEVKPTSSIYIHPAFWRALGINVESLGSKVTDKEEE